MGRRLRGWLRLSWGDRLRLLLMMAVGLPAVHLSLRLRGYMETRRLLERLSERETRRTPTSDELESASELVRLAAIAGQRTPVRATCLRQSLLVYWMLRRRALDPNLRIGVRKEDGTVDAHAWVELEGSHLSDPRTEYEPFPLH